MKISNAKSVFAALIICSTAALAGSISSTIAWYQYSTRVTAIYLGASAGTKGNLKLRIKGSDQWLSDLTYRDVADYLSNNNKGQYIAPITSGPMNADDAIKTNDQGEKIFYQNPDGGVPVQTVNYENESWKIADDSMYASIPLEICFEAERETGISYLEKDVYISDLLIQADWRNNSNPQNIKTFLKQSEFISVRIKAMIKV